MFYKYCRVAGCRNTCAVGSPEVRLDAGGRGPVAAVRVSLDRGGKVWRLAEVHHEAEEINRGMVWLLWLYDVQETLSLEPAREESSLIYLNRRVSYQAIVVSFGNGLSSLEIV